MEGLGAFGAARCNGWKLPRVGRRLGRSPASDILCKKASLGWTGPSLWQWRRLRPAGSGLPVRVQGRAVGPQVWGTERVGRATIQPPFRISPSWSLMVTIMFWRTKAAAMLYPLQSTWTQQSLPTGKLNSCFAK